jgi:Ca-activated chloride channel family protein
MNWFRFGNPEFLFFLWIGLPILILLLLFGLRMKRRAMLLFQSNVNAAHLKRHKIQVVLLMLSYFCVAIAIAQPQWGVKPETVAERLDVMLAVDISTSMLSVDDNSVRRLTQAKDFMFSLLERLKGDRVGLLYFAEASVVVCPLTSDVNTLREFLASLTPETLAHRGTHIGNAIKVATDRFVSNKSNLTTLDTDSNGQKVLILFTDGEDHGDNAVEAAKAAERDDIHIYCVGVGSSEKPAPIPLPVESAGYKRNVNGQLVLTALDEVSLREIAEAGNGKYYHANEGVARLTIDLERLEKQKFRVRSDGEYQVRFQWFVGLALFLLLGELLMRTWINIKGR